MMRKNLFTLLLMTVMPLLIGCGDDDNDEPKVTTTPPKMVAVTPANGATDIATGTVDITVEYDQNILFATSSASLINISGGTITRVQSSGKTLAITADCPSQGTTVSITIPAGLVRNSQQQGAEAVSFSFTTVQPTVIPPTPSKTPVAATTAEATRLYNYLWQQYGKKTISSVMANVNWNNECAEKVYRLTGKYPAMNCYDFIHVCFSPANWIDYTDITPVQKWVNAGGLVQLMWHFNVPKLQGADDYTCTPSETTFRAANVFTEGSWENRWFYSQMDKVVATMLKLQEAGIAATWRPFHEAAGNATARQQAGWTKAWFWWGYDGAETYKRLWTTMFDYFKQKGIRNLIWVWTTQNYNGNSGSFRQDTDWYPGDEYVDIVARDLYGYSAASNKKEFDEIQAAYPDKMVALGECGRDGSSGTEAARPADFWSAGAHWSHFMVWYQGEQGSTDTMCSDAWWKAAMSSPDVITRDLLPN